MYGITPNSSSSFITGQSGGSGALYTGTQVKPSSIGLTGNVTGQSIGIMPKPSNALMTPVGGSQTAIATNSSPTPTFENGDVLGAEAAAAAAAQRKAAEDAARAGQLRGEITSLVNSVKDIFNSRYGQVDASGAEQGKNLQTRFNTESGDIAQQVDGENQQLGAAYAGRGAFDSSYRGNDVDTVTRAGESQVQGLSTELQENLNAIASWIKQQKAGFDAEKGSMDTILSRLNEETDPNRLTDLRNTLDAKIAQLKAGNADNNIKSQNKDALETIAPSKVRAQQLNTTLSQIVAGGADAGTKLAIGTKLIKSAGLDPEDEQALLSGFQGNISASENKEQV